MYSQKEINFWVSFAFIVGGISAVFGGIKSCMGCDNKTEEKDDEKQEKDSDESSILLNTDGYEIVRDDGSKIEFSFPEIS